MRFRLGIVLAAAALSVFAMGAGSASAQVATTAPAVQTVAAGDVGALDCVGPVSPDGGAGACFEPHGEHLFNCDLLADGHHPVAHYYRSTSPNTRRTVSDAPTAGYCVDHNLTNIPESGWIKVQSCNYEGSTKLSCSSYVKISANG